MSIVKQYRHIPFNKGLDNRIDERLAPDGFMDKLENTTFVHEGSVQAGPSFLLINDPANFNYNIKSIHTVSDSEMFLFTGEGAYLKQDDNNFHKVDRQNFFDSESEFLSREEENIHHPSVVKKSDYTLSTYQTKTGERSQVNYFLFDSKTKVLIKKGVLTKARDPIAFLTDNDRGFLYKDAENNLVFFNIDNLIKTPIKSFSEGDKLYHTDNDTTSVVKISDSEALWFAKGWSQAEERNKLLVNRLRLDNIEVLNGRAISDQVVTLSGLGDREDLGKVWANHLNPRDSTVTLCMTTRVGFSSPAPGGRFYRSQIEVYEYDLSTDNFRFDFAVNVDNTLDNEIIAAVVEPVSQNITYQTFGADIYSVSPTDAPKLRFDQHALLDSWHHLGHHYYLIANRNGFFILSDTYSILNKMNPDHLTEYTNIRKIQVQIYEDRFFIPTPRLTSIEGYRERGFSLHIDDVRLDLDQRREVESFGNYYMVSASPIAFYDKRQMVEYGFHKRPTMSVDSIYKR